MLVGCVVKWWCSCLLCYKIISLEMATERNIIDQLRRAATNASSNETPEETNFGELVRATRRNFRRYQESPENSSPRRGRKRKRIFKKKVVIMKLAHADFFPSSAELKYLKQRGLGEADEFLEVCRESSLKEIKDRIIELYGENIQALLRMCGFKIARVGKSKQIFVLDSIQDGDDLEEQIKQGKIIILPNNDFPNNLPVVEQVNSLNSSSNPSTSHHDYQHPITRNTRREIESSVVQSEEEELESPNIPLPITNNIVFPSLPESVEVEIFEISRSDCLHDLLNIYTNQDLLNKRLHVKFIGELGVDGGGLTKEVFNIFFEKCEGIFFHGEDCLVTYLPLNKINEQDKFIIIGRILQHMLLLTNTIPTKLSRITLMLIADPDREIENSVLLEELLSFANPYLRKILKKAKKNFPSLTDKEMDVIQDFFQTNKFLARPTSDTFVEQIAIIATEILVEKPKRLIMKMRTGISPEKYPNFWNNCDFTVLMEMQYPTAAKIINCLITDLNLTNEENEILHYLTMYVNCLDSEKLQKFLFLITGSMSMPSNIYVKFNDFIGLSQRPTFSTCTNTLTLPKTYGNYNELKNDLNICLSRDEATEYTYY